jgi:CubicO group peptidase (beta-lactamase class C family)
VPEADAASYRPGMTTSARRLAATLLGLGPVLAPSLIAQGSPPRALRDLDAWITRGVRDWQIPGLSVSIVRGDSVVFARGYGVRQLGAAGAVDTATQFGIMSTTKAFTALAMAMLVDSGRVAWDDPVTKHLPEFQFRDPFLTREVTVRDLLTHNTGLGNADLLWVRGDLKRAEILRRVREIPTAYSLRSSFVYQNVMYGTAGELIARVSGMPWEEFVQRRILVPLGMTRTYATYAAMRAATGVNQSAPHYKIRDTIRVIADDSVDELPAAGSIWSSAGDMAKWLRFLVDSGRVNGRRLVSAANFAEWFRPQVMVPASQFYPTAERTRPRWMTYGLGWFQQDFRGRFLAFHTGSLDGRTAMVGVQPDSRVGVFIAGSLDHAEFRHAVLLQAMDVLAGTNGEPARDWSAEFLALYGRMQAEGDSARRAAEAKRVTGTQPSAPMASFAGRYVHPLWGDLEILSQRDGSLVLKMGSNPLLTGRLTHWHYDTFRVELGDGRGGANYFDFQRGADGSVSSVRMDGSEEYRFERAPAP